MAKEQSLNLSISPKRFFFFFSKGKKKGKDVRPGKARRYSVTEVDQSRANIWANPYNAGLISKDSEWQFFVREP